MATAVFFPDGVVKEVPSQLRMMSKPEIQFAPVYEQVPLNCDPFWKYQCVNGRWIAQRRARQVAALHQPIEEWWRSISQMADDLPEARQPCGHQVERDGPEDSSARRSAA
jgi:hypothetical protein